MDLVISVFPAVIFLIFLFLLDSFKLVSYKLLIMCFLWGILSALISYLFNSFLPIFSEDSPKALTLIQAPVTEEILKAFVIYIFLSTKKIGFSIDAIIYGFAIGTGFSLAENVYYLNVNPDPNLLIWVVRGLGTSLMHGGCTSLLAMITLGRADKHRIRPLNIISGLVTAILMHSLFNSFYFDPLLQTLGLLLIMPLLFLSIFYFKERALRKWLDLEFYNEVELLSKIRRGEVSETNAGIYLNSLRDRFKPEIILDMYCYLSLYLELSVKAKRNILLRESGIEPPIEEDIEQKLKELLHLRRDIGKVGELTLAPLIKMSYNDLWKLKQLS